MTINEKTKDPNPNPYDDVFQLVLHISLNIIPTEFNGIYSQIKGAQA